jgi:hypothetical protein
MAPKKPVAEMTNDMHFAWISWYYLRAYQLIAQQNDTSQIESDFEIGLLLHPISQVLGLALETSIKGLQSCRTGRYSRGHNLISLYQELNDNQLSETINNKLEGIQVPKDFLDANTEKLGESNTLRGYRSDWLQIRLLNGVYDAPYISRYPPEEAFSLPNPLAIEIIVTTILSTLNSEIRSREPKKIDD